MTDKEKKDYIISKGWYTMWHENYWVHNSIMAGANLDWCGIDLHSAYACQLKNESKS